MESTLDIEYDQVFIIDCLPEHQYQQWEISQDLMKFLASEGIQQATSICRNKKLVVATLNHLEKLAKSGITFCLHIISHGDKNGLWIETTNEEILWDEFRESLSKINRHMQGNFIVNMTSCVGLQGIRIVDENSSDAPFFGLVGYSQDLPVSRGKEINELFYKKILDGKLINTAVEELRIQLSDSNIYCVTSKFYQMVKSHLGRHI